MSIGLAESLFEKGGNIYKVLELANRGLMETMNGGKFELQFVGAALVARVYLVTGHPGDSVKTLEELETRAQQRGARRVVRNVRALQVLRLQDRGLTRSEIARQLQLSERSVKYQCEQAYHKLGTSNKVEALAAARKLNLL